MGKKKDLHTLKQDLYDRLCELIEDENEMEVLDHETHADKDRENIRKGMMHALTEDFFSKVMRIVEDEEAIETAEAEPEKNS